jgi:lipopolysaccharide transport system ATP-binding protein
MSETIILAESLGKKYTLNHRGNKQQYLTLRDLIADRLQMPRRWIRSLNTTGSTHIHDKGSHSYYKRTEAPSLSEEAFWALSDVHFEIKAGEVIGIIGPNGAGKSTLLKILSRITEPSVGRVRIKGRVASLLEVGTGFHPELSGRENIYLNGAILGMTRDEIKRKFDEIVAFAEVEKFLDTPVKRYSSGMYVRLAFAVAAHLEPEILIVDEVLAVGDAQFQKKCLSKMGDIAARQSRTVLFVSHNMVAVQSLCRRTICLNQGSIKFDGPTAQAVTTYLSETFEQGAEQLWRDIETAPGNEIVRIARVSILTNSSEDDSTITMKTPFSIITEYWARKAGHVFHITYHLINEQGIVVFTTWSRTMPHAEGRYRSVCDVPGGLLNSGLYYLRLFIVEDGARVTFEKDGLVSFQVLDRQERVEGWMGREPGVIQPSLSWNTERMSCV